MKIFVVVYTYSAPENELAKYRQEHREYLVAQPELRVSGPFVGGEAGALLIFEAEDEARVIEIITNDPFHVNGCIGQREVRNWKPVSGNLAPYFASV